MKTLLCGGGWETVFCCAGGLAFVVAPAAAEDGATSLWEVRMSANALFNASANFKGHPSTPFLTSGQSQPGAVNYDNGYVGKDISGDPTLTTFWSYTQSSQQVLSSGNVVGLNYQRTIPVAGPCSPRAPADPGPGGDIVLRRQLGMFSNARFGLELGASFNQINAKDDSSYVTDGQRTDYTHGLAAAMPAGLFPPAGYQGPYSGLGPNLNPTPTAGQTTTSVGAVLASGSREVDADIFGFRFGPYLELPITRRFSVSASAGLALALVHDQVWWTEQLAVNTANVNHYWTGQSSVAGDSLGVTAGFYLGAGVNYYLSPKLRLFGGGRFQDAGTYRHEIGQGEMNLDLRQAFNLELGLGYSF